MIHKRSISENILLEGLNWFPKYENIINFLTTIIPAITPNFLKLYS